MAEGKTVEERVAALETALLRVRRAAGERFRRLDGEVDDALREAKAAQMAAEEAQSTADEALIEAQDAADAAKKGRR